MEYLVQSEHHTAFKSRQKQKKGYDGHNNISQWDDCSDDKRKQNSL